MNIRAEERLVHSTWSTLTASHRTRGDTINGSLKFELCELVYVTHTKEQSCGQRGCRVTCVSAETDVAANKVVRKRDEQSDCVLERMRSD